LYIWRGAGANRTTIIERGSVEEEENEKIQDVGEFLAKPDRYILSCPDQEPVMVSS
jgi:hypothetical protein